MIVRPPAWPVPANVFRMVFRIRPFRPAGPPSLQGEAALGPLIGEENASKDGMPMRDEAADSSGPGQTGFRPMAARAGGSSGSGPEQGKHHNESGLPASENGDPGP